MVQNESLERKEYSGRFPNLGQETWKSIISFVVLMLKRNDRVSCSTIQDHIKETYGVEISVDTISRRLKDSYQRKSKWQQRKAFVSFKNQKLNVK